MFWSVIEVAQAADIVRLLPSCFLDSMVQRAALPLMRLPSIMKPEPYRSDSSAKSTSLPFLVKTLLHKSLCEAQAPESSKAFACVSGKSRALVNTRPGRSARQNRNIAVSLNEVEKKFICGGMP